MEDLRRGLVSGDGFGYAHRGEMTQGGDELLCEAAASCSDADEYSYVVPSIVEAGSDVSGDGRRDAGRGGLEEAEGNSGKGSAHPVVR
jgi:hypothetical protein